MQSLSDQGWSFMRSMNFMTFYASNEVKCFYNFEECIVCWLTSSATVIIVMSSEELNIMLYRYMKLTLETMGNWITRLFIGYVK